MIVVPPPVIQSITRSNNAVTITWKSISGQKYRLQFKDNVTDLIWNNLTPDVTASGPTASKQDMIGLGTRRFYRIAVVP